MSLNLLFKDFGFGRRVFAGGIGRARSVAGGLLAIQIAGNSTVMSG
jgi:hypothetical protein